MALGSYREVMVVVVLMRKMKKTCVEIVVVCCDVIKAKFDFVDKNVFSKKFKLSFTDFMLTSPILCTPFFLKTHHRFYSEVLKRAVQCPRWSCLIVFIVYQ